MGDHLSIFVEETDASGGSESVPGGGGVTSEATPPPSPATAPASEVVSPGDNVSGGRTLVPPESTDEPGKPLGDSAPALESLQNQLCPNCKVGVLYVTRYDPHALHEQGQDIWVQNQPRALPEGWESGGAYELRCFNCEWTHSAPMNPGKNYGKPRA